MVENVAIVSERSSTFIRKPSSVGINELCLWWMVAVLYVWYYLLTSKIIMMSDDVLFRHFI